MTFSKALKLLKLHEKVKRITWEPGIYLQIVSASICIRTKDNHFSPWVVSHDDLLSEDWDILN